MQTERQNAGNAKYAKGIFLNTRRLSDRNTRIKSFDSERALRTQSVVLNVSRRAEACRPFGKAGEH
jgi:hypothetical protein